MGWANAEDIVSTVDAEVLRTQPSPRKGVEAMLFWYDGRRLEDAYRAQARERRILGRRVVLGRARPWSPDDGNDPGDGGIAAPAAEPADDRHEARLALAAEALAQLQAAADAAGVDQKDLGLAIERHAPRPIAWGALEARHRLGRGRPRRVVASVIEQLERAGVQRVRNLLSRAHYLDWSPAP